MRRVQSVFVSVAVSPTHTGAARAVIIYVVHYHLLSAQIVSNCDQLKIYRAVPTVVSKTHCDSLSAQAYVAGANASSTLGRVVVPGPAVVYHSTASFCDKHRAVC
eukprot:m.1200204 g.1200204  ORF g.1200204 m.1200204 type:complete len:105 (+) comp24572_c0_seq34:1544-1858(+)